MKARLSVPALSERARDALLQTFPHADALYLFGSAARGAAHEDSDIDLAVLCAGSIPAAILFEAQRNLSVMLDVDVDLVDLSSAPTVLQCEVVMRGQRIFEREHEPVLDFEARVLSDYGHLLETTRDLRTRMRERLAAQ